MGERINYVFDDGSESLTVLYSHWGATDWEDDLIGALEHAQPRHRDYSYFTRMIISHLIQKDILSETGFGIYSISRSELSDLSDTVIVLNLVSDRIHLPTGLTVPFYGKVMA